MKNRILNLLALALLIVLALCTFSSCSSKRVNVSIENLMDENTEYSYKGLSWGSNESDVKETLGISLNDPMEYTAPGSNETIKRYITADTAELIFNSGKTVIGSTHMYFKSNQLCEIAFSFEIPPDVSADEYEYLVKNLTEMYGNPDYSDERTTASGNPPAFGSEFVGLRWYRITEEKQIVLSLVLQYSARGGESDVINIGVEDYRGEGRLVE